MSVQLCFDGSEDKLNGIEPWSVWRKSDTHELSVAKELSCLCVCMYTCIVHDEHKLLSVLIELILSILIKSSILISQHCLKFLHELNKRISSVDPYSHLWVQDTMITQSTYSGALCRLVVLYRCWVQLWYPWVWLNSSAVEWHFIDPYESTSLDNHMLHDGLEPISKLFVFVLSIKVLHS